MNLTSMKCKEATKHPLHHPHFLCHSPDQSIGPSSFWNFPHSLKSKHPMFICTTSHTHRTRDRTHMESGDAPRTEVPILLSCPLCPYLGPRAGGAPGAEQGTSCSAGAAGTDCSWEASGRPRPGAACGRLSAALSTLWPPESRVVRSAGPCTRRRPRGRGWLRAGGRGRRPRTSGRGLGGATRSPGVCGRRTCTFHSSGGWGILEGVPGSCGFPSAPWA